MMPSNAPGAVRGLKERNLMKKHPGSRGEVEDGTSEYRLPAPLPPVASCSLKEPPRFLKLPRSRARHRTERAFGVSLARNGFQTAAAAMVGGQRERRVGPAPGC